MELLVRMSQGSRTALAIVAHALQLTRLRAAIRPTSTDFRPPPMYAAR
jgi:hypothetical protein